MSDVTDDPAALREALGRARAALFPGASMPLGYWVAIDPDGAGVTELAVEPDGLRVARSELGLAFAPLGRIETAIVAAAWIDPTARLASANAWAERIGIRRPGGEAIESIRSALERLSRRGITRLAGDGASSARTSRVGLLAHDAGGYGADPAFVALATRLRGALPAAAALRRARGLPARRLRLWAAIATLRPPYEGFVSVRIGQAELGRILGVSGARADRGRAYVTEALATLAGEPAFRGSERLTDGTCLVVRSQV